MKHPLIFLMMVVATALFLTGCSAHCDKSACPVVDKSKLTIIHLAGRPGSQVRKPYKTAVFGEISAPPVLILHDMNGASPNGLSLADKLASAGFCTYFPNLFAGKGLDLGSKSMLRSSAYLASNPDWNVTAKHDCGPVLEDMACMVRAISARHPGHRVIVIGNCLTGIHPLGLLDDPCVSKVVLCQPATPLKSIYRICFNRDQTPRQSRALGLSDYEFHRSIDAMRRDSSKRIAVMHYTNDPLAPMLRIDELHNRLSDAGLAARMSTYVLHPDGVVKPHWWTDQNGTGLRPLIG